jgi:hypothetical protein
MMCTWGTVPCAAQVVALREELGTHDLSEAFRALQKSMVGLLRRRAVAALRPNPDLGPRTRSWLPADAPVRQQDEPPRRVAFRAAAAQVPSMAHADYVLSTAHGMKGLEADVVQLAEDFRVKLVRSTF